jgi:transcriptional regulator with XRE-family HTH domain
MPEKTGDPEIAARLRNLRLKRNLTQEQLAEKAGVSRATIRKIEIADRAIGKEVAPKLAEALKTTESYLIFGVEANPEPPQKPKSRIPDLPPDDPPLTPEEIAALNDPRLGGIFYSKPYLSRLSNRQLRQIALDALTLIEEINENEQ